MFRARCYQSGSSRARIFYARRQAHTFSDKQGDRHPSFDYQLKRIGEMTEKVFSLSIEK